MNIMRLISFRKTVNLILKCGFPIVRLLYIYLVTLIKMMCSLLDGNHRFFWLGIWIFSGILLEFAGPINPKFPETSFGKIKPSPYKP